MKTATKHNKKKPSKQDVPFYLIIERQTEKDFSVNKEEKQSFVEATLTL